MNGKSVYGSVATFAVLAVGATLAIIWSGRTNDKPADTQSGDVAAHVIVHAGSDTILNTLIDAPPPGTALAALETAAKNHRVPLGTQQFDFGVLVASIGKYTAGADGDWTYRVNDTMPKVGAADLKLNEGDRIEFRFGPGQSDSVVLEPGDTATLP
jgi:hypothetical protein